MADDRHVPNQCGYFSDRIVVKFQSAQNFTRHFCSNFRMTVKMMDSVFILCAAFYAFVAAYWAG